MFEKPPNNTAMLCFPAWNPALPLGRDFRDFFLNPFESHGGLSAVEVREEPAVHQHLQHPLHAEAGEPRRENPPEVPPSGGGSSGDQKYSRRENKTARPSYS